MNEEINIGNILKLYRKKKRLYQKEIASKLGISREYYSQLENRKATPSLNLLINICKVTEINFAELLLESDSNICLLCHSLTFKDKELIKLIIQNMEVDGV